MSRLSWDNVGERLFETGVKKGVVYPMVSGNYTTGVAWNGLTAVNENPSGAEPTALYADNIKYLNIMSAEEYAATIEAFTYPNEFAVCDGSAEIATGVAIRQQKRTPFGFSYVTLIGNDTDDTDLGYKIHLVYNAMAKPTDRSYGTVNETPDAVTFSWEISTTPVPVPGHKPTATVTIDSTKANAAELAALEAILYGTESEDPRLPLPSELLTIFSTSLITNG